MVVGDDLVHVDADHDADQRHLFQMRSQREIAGRPQVADEGVEPLDVGVVGEDARELLQEGVFAVVGKEAGGHAGAGAQGRG